MTQEVLKLALEALELCNGAETVDGVVIYTHKEIVAIKEALRENAMREVQRLGQEIEQEPCDMGEMCLGCSPRRADGSCPDVKPWVGLTESDRRLINFEWQDGNGTATEIIDLVEAKLKEKNT